MSSVWSSTEQEPSGQQEASESTQDRLSTLIYRSRASRPLLETDLHQMLDCARARNRASAVTGLLIYERGQFFQWLEGPADAVAGIWQSIQADRRHTAIEILGEESTMSRVFGDWDMKLGLQHPCSDGMSRNTMAVPAGLLDQLDQRPGSAMALLAALAPDLSSPDAFAGYQQLAGTNSHGGRDSLILQGVIGNRIIPELLRRHPQVTPDLLPDAINPGVAKLAKLLIASEPEAAFELINLLQTGTGSIARLCATALEPAARILGDLWNADDCSETDVFFGMHQIQMAIRRSNIAMVPIVFHVAPMPAVLVAPQPGEVHALSAALDAEVLWHDGWDIHCEHPDSDQALNALVADTWFDALDLSLSTAFRQDDWLPRMAETIRQVRKASRNPSLVVVVGGRMFFEQKDAGKRVGADAAIANAQQLAPFILEAMRRHR